LPAHDAHDAPADGSVAGQAATYFGDAVTSHTPALLHVYVRVPADGRDSHISAYGHARLGVEQGSPTLGCGGHVGVAGGLHPPLIGSQLPLMHMKDGVPLHRSPQEAVPMHGVPAFV
jgi:hypothetical protein